MSIGLLISRLVGRLISLSQGPAFWIKVTRNDTTQYFFKGNSNFTTSILTVIFMFWWKAISICCEITQKSLELGRSIYIKELLTTFLDIWVNKKSNYTTPKVKSVTSLHKYIKTTDINKYNILYVAFDASFLLLLPTYLSKFWVII